MWQRINHSAAFCVFLASCTPAPAPCPQPGATPTAAPTPLPEPEPPLARDPEIEAALAKIDPARLEADVRAMAAFGTRHSLSETESETRGIGAARRWLKKRFEEVGGRLQVRLAPFTVPAGDRIPKPWPMENVLAVLPGTVTGAGARTIVVSGHLDSRATDAMDATIDAPGANDDASGVAVVLEACRVLAPLSFEATLMFVAVSGEEQGLYGSKALVAELQAAGVVVEAMFTNDIVGNSVSAAGKSDKRQVRVFSAGLPPEGALRDTLLSVGGENDAPSRQLARATVEVADTYLKDFDAMLVARLDRYLRGGDHRPFHEAGIPAIRFTEVHENFERQHQDVRGDRFGDLPDHVDAEYMANVARLNAATLASLARAPRAPRDVRLDVRGLAEDTTLLWTPEEGVSYEIVGRATTEPTWTQTFAAGNTGSFTLPLSKDHNHVGLRAVGPKGHRSIAVFPLPLRAP